MNQKSIQAQQGDADDGNISVQYTTINVSLTHIGSNVMKTIEEKKMNLQFKRERGAI